MPLLEREHPLQVLRDRAGRAADGGGGLVLLAGEAGIGKTVLLRAFAAELPAGRALWGMCDPLGTPRPLGPLRDVAAELGEPLTGLLRGDGARHEIFAAALEALRRTPRVLVVEDVHWADEATLDLLRYLARRVAGLPLLLVVTYRDGLGAGDPLGAALGDLVSSPDARRMQLAPLSRSAVATLVAGSDLDPAEVHRRTAGNPFFVSQIVDQPDAPLPASVRDAVVARTAALPARARQDLELLACTPEPVGGALLAALGLGPESVGRLTATGLLDGHGDGVAFRHEIARTAVLSAVPPGAGPALHAAMLAALERTGADPAVLVHHAEGAGDRERTVRYTALAGAEAARSGAHREAAAHYRRAVAHAPADPALLEALADELYLTDLLDEAIAVRERALAVRRTQADPVAVGAGHRVISYFHWYAADRAAAEVQDAAAHEVLRGTADTRELGYALANRAFLAAQRGDPEAAARAGGRAREIASGLADEALAGTASIGAAVARLSRGDLGARADLLAARDTGLRLGLDDLATTPMSNLAHLDVEQGRLAEAEDVLEGALRVSEERDVPVCSMWQLGVRSRLRLLTGRWAEAEADAHAVLATGRIPLGRLWPTLVLGLLAARREAPADSPRLDEMWELAQRLAVPDKLAAAAAALAENAWLRRVPDGRLAGIGDLVAWSAERPHAGGALARWAARLAAAGVQDLGGGVRVRGDETQDGVPAPPEQPYEHALARWDAGTAEDLLAALPLLDGLGARAAAIRVRARLRELGTVVPRGPAPATRANPARLTARQLDVLALLVDGLSNAEIAARLVISPKTADHHVSAILAKLEVRSRGEAAAAARRLGV